MWQSCVMSGKRYSTLLEHDPLYFLKGNPPSCSLALSLVTIKILQHLEKLLDYREDANLDPKPSEYLLAWLSYFVLNPGKRSKVAIILRGVQAGIPPFH